MDKSVEYEVECVCVMMVQRKDHTHARTHTHTTLLVSGLVMMGGLKGNLCFTKIHLFK